MLQLILPFAWATYMAAADDDYYYLFFFPYLAPLPIHLRLCLALCMSEIALKR